MAPRLTLYDLKGTREPWNFNAAKTRQLLHAKDLTFDVIWVHYTTMAQTMMADGYEGDQTKKPPLASSHTVPTLGIEEDGKREFVTDSEHIAKRIEELFPDRGLIVDQDAPLYPQVDQLLVNEILKPTRNMVVTHVGNTILDLPADQKYFHETREHREGIKFAAPKPRDPQFEAAEAGVTKLGNMLLDKPGPFLLGAKPSYGDVRICSMIWAFDIVGERERLFSLDEHGGLAKLWKATSSWRPEMA